MVGPINPTCTVAPTDALRIVLLVKVVLILVTTVMAGATFHLLRTGSPLWPGAGAVTIGCFMCFLAILATFVILAQRR